MRKTLILTLLFVITGCGPKQLDVTRSAILSALPEGAIGRLGPTSDPVQPPKALIGLQKQVAVTFLSDERFVSASDIEPLSGSSVHLWSLKTDQAWSTGIDQKVSGFIISEHTERVAVSFPYTGDIDPHFANHGYGRVIFYDLNSWRQLDTVGEYYEAHTAFSNDENQLLMAGTHHEWHLYDLEQNRIIARSHPLGRPTSRQSTHLQEGSPSADIWFPYETSYLERRRSQISSVGFDPHHQMFVFG